MVDEDPWCRARIDGVCTGLGEDGHEPLLRSRGGDPADPNNIVLLCRACHDHAHANPLVAETLGLMRHSWDAA
ncbi:HNH endonuclease [Frankia sp. AgB32]|uniref:HNH endonuclease n=1 Tax=Frankia sp. AgB32 TaxID=631119 RepID=UPI0034D4CA77